MSFFYENKDRLECRRFQDLTYLDHFHDHIEMLYVKEGAGVARVDGEEYPYRPGDVFIAFPNQIHSYQDALTCSGIICIFSCKPFLELSPIFRGKVPESPIVRREKLPPQVPGLFEAMLEGAQLEQPFRDSVIRGYIGVILGLILPLMSLRDVDAASSDTIQNILRYCSENYQQDISLDSAAADLHISKYHISHLFSQKIRIGFNDFINMLRVQEACRQLKQGTGITDASVSAGFNSIRSFNRVFLHRTGMTPLKYQKQYRTDTKEKSEKDG